MGRAKRQRLSQGPGHEQRRGMSWPADIPRRLPPRFNAPDLNNALFLSVSIHVRALFPAKPLFCFAFYRTEKMI